MPPNIKNKTNSIYYLPHNKDYSQYSWGGHYHLQTQTNDGTKQKTKKQNKQTWVKERNLCIITTNEIAGKLPQHTSILNTVIE